MFLSTAVPDIGVVANLELFVGSSTMSARLLTLTEVYGMLLLALLSSNIFGKVIDSSSNEPGKSNVGRYRHYRTGRAKYTWII